MKDTYVTASVQLVCSLDETADIESDTVRRNLWEEPESLFHEKVAGKGAVENCEVVDVGAREEEHRAIVYLDCIVGISGKKERVDAVQIAHDELRPLIENHVEGYEGETFEIVESVLDKDLASYKV